MNDILRVLIVFLCAISSINAQENHEKTQFACESSNMHLTCPTGSYVSIIRANYGRFSISVCNVQAITDIDTNCGTEEETTQLLSKM